MIVSYTKPQLTIKQILDIVEPGPLDRINTLIVGPQYKVSTYSPADLNRSGVAYDPENGVTIPYVFGDETLDSDLKIDTSYTKVYAEDLPVLLNSFGDQGGVDTTIATGKYAMLKSFDEANRVEILNGTNVAVDASGVFTSAASSTPANLSVLGGASLDADLQGRPVRVGDKVKVRLVKNDTDVATNPWTTATVIGLEGKDVDASSFTDEAVTATAYNPKLNAGETTTSSNGNTYSLTDTSDADPSALLAKFGTSYAPYRAGVKFTLTSSGDGSAQAHYLITNVSGGLTATVTDYTTQVLTFTLSDGTVTETFKLTLDADLTTSSTVVTFASTYTAANRPTITGTYNGISDTQYTIKVLQGGTVGTDDIVLQIFDNTRQDSNNGSNVMTVAFDGTYVADTDVSFGSLGLAIALPTGFQNKGDVFTLSASSAKLSTTEFSKFILNKDALDNLQDWEEGQLLEVELFTMYNGYIDPRNNAINGGSGVESYTSLDIETALNDGVTPGVTVATDMLLPVSGRNINYRYCPAAKGGTLYATWRALVPTKLGETYTLVSTISEITEKFGTVEMDNVLAYGAATALQGSQGKSIFVLKVDGTDRTAFAEALQKVESTDLTYALCPLTDDIGIKKDFASHCEAMSQEDVKNFRRCYVGTESPGDYPIYQKDSDGLDLLATVGTLNGKFVKLTCDDAFFTSLGLVDGDVVRINYATNVWGDASFEEFEVKDVISDTELELKTPLVSAISVPTKFEVWKKDNPESQIDYVIQQSKTLGSRRAANVWVEKPTIVTGTTISIVPVMYVAAEIAGLRSAVVPQQGLTLTEIESITSAPLMYTRYTNTLLNKAASNGVMIVTQDADSGVIYIRHQLTTQSSKGILYYEDSVGTNLDNLSFKIKDTQSGFIGKRNVNLKTLSDIRSVIVRILAQAASNPLDLDIGPEINGWDKLTLEIDEFFKDRVNVSVQVFLPVPLNQLAYTLRGSVVFGEFEQAIEDQANQVNE